MANQNGKWRQEILHSHLFKIETQYFKHFTRLEIEQFSMSLVGFRKTYLNSSFRSTSWDSNESRKDWIRFKMNFIRIFENSCVVPV